MKNLARKWREPAQGFSFDKTINKQAVQNASESMRYSPQPVHVGFSHLNASVHAVCGHFFLGDARG